MLVFTWILINIALELSYDLVPEKLDISYVIILNKLGFLLGIVLISALHRFTTLFESKIGSLKQNKIIDYSGILLAILVFLPLISGNFMLENGVLLYQYGNLSILVVVYFVVVSIFAIKNTLKIIKYSNDLNTRRQAKIMLAGLISTGVYAVLFILVLPIIFNNDNYTFFGYYAPLIFTATLIYSIIKLKFLDIRLLAIRAFAYTVTLSIILLIFIILMLVIVDYVLDANLSTQDIIVIGAISLVVANCYQPLQLYFNKLTISIFYKDAYDEKDFINEINYKIVNSKEHELLLDWVVNNINKKMHLKYCAIYIDPSSALDRHLFSTNITKFNIETFGRFLKLIDSDNIIIDRNDSANNTDVNELMDELELEAVVKMYSLDEVIGYLIIGPKKSGSAITQSDVKVLKILSDSLAVATQNELRYQEIAKFNLTLKQNIDTATKELQATNKKLQSLDEAKDEFISMASHQLRTPLTSIKGYISMILEGDAGDINEQQRNFLNQAFISSQRMVFLISDLLNVSRLKTGKFVIEKTEADLCEMVQSEVDQLIPTAEGRGLSLEFKAPDNYPKVVLDETKTLQVIMNFIDNAIYYTPKGGHIKVELSHDDTSVTYKVIDNGLGVPKAVQHELFTKFYRAENAKKARPDGTGLGLYMAKKVVIAQGGHIIFESQEGKGSTFGFSLPLNNENDEVRSTP
jgi:signal transduction histidine kinase